MQIASAVIAGFALIVSIVAIWYSRRLGLRLQKQDHDHARSLQAQQQAHERRLSEFETQVQADIRNLTADMVRRAAEIVVIERGRDEEARRAAGSARVNARIISSDDGRVALEIVNHGPATAKNVDVVIHGRLQGQEGRTPEFTNRKVLPPENALPPGDKVSLRLALFGTIGADVEWSWEDRRSGRQMDRRVLRLESERSAKVW